MLGMSLVPSFAVAKGGCSHRPKLTTRADCALTSVCRLPVVNRRSAQTAEMIKFESTVTGLTNVALLGSRLVNRHGSLFGCIRRSKSSCAGVKRATAPEFTQGRARVINGVSTAPRPSGGLPASLPRRYGVVIHP